jgi:hypothetical protein
MTNLRFTPGLLSSIRDFGSDLAGSQAGARSALTGAGVQPASLGGMLARNVGNLMGRDMRSPQEKQMQALQGLDPNDPASMEAMIKALSITDPERAIELAGIVRTRREKIAQDKAKQAKQTAQNDSYLSILEITREEGDLDLQRIFEIAQEADLDYSKVNDLIKLQSTQRQGTRSSTKVGTMRAADAEGNNVGQYNVTSIYDPVTNETSTINSPIGNAPSFESLPKDTKIDFISTTTGLSGFEANELKQANSKLETQLDFLKKEFETGTETAVESQEKYLAASEGLTIGNRLISALEVIETGGNLNTALKIVGDALGTTPANVGQFQVDAGALMIQKLRSFGGNPTEGERNAAAALAPRIENSKKLNKVIITAYIQEMSRRQQINEYRSRTIKDSSVPGGRRYPRPEEIIDYMKQVYAGTGFAGGTAPKYTFGDPTNG